MNLPCHRKEEVSSNIWGIPLLKKIPLRKILLHSLLLVIASFVAIVGQLTPLSAEGIGQELRAQVVLQSRHSDLVWSVAFSPDGRTALSGSGDKTIKLWDVATERLLRTFTGHSDRISSVAFSPDGRTFLSGSRDQTIKLWDALSGREIRTLTGHTGWVFSVAFSPDGRTALSGSQDKTIKLWDVASGREIRTLRGHSDAVFSVAFSPDGRTALSGSADNTIKLWDIASGREIKTLTGHTGWVRSVAFSPDGRTVLSGSQDKTMKLWDVASGGEIRTFTGHPSVIDSVAFSPDGNAALSGGGTFVRLWDLASGRELWIKWHGNNASPVAFSPGGRIVLSGGWSPETALWDATNGRLLGSLSGFSHDVASVAFLPDGRTALSGSHNLTSWDITSGRALRSFIERSPKQMVPNVSAVALSLDGRTALSNVDSTIALWHVETGRRIKIVTENSNVFAKVALSPDGRTALSSFEKTIKLWEVASGQEIRTFTGHSGWVTAVAFSPDGRTALSGSEDKTIKLWDVESGRELRTFTGHSGRVTAVAFSPDGRTALSGSEDKTIKLWDVPSGRELRTFAGHSDGVSSVAFSPDGRTALSGSRDNLAKLWDLASGRVLRTLSAHSSPIMSVALSPNGRDVLAGSADGWMHLWDNGTGNERASWISFYDGSWLTITPEGFFDASSPQAAHNISIVRGLEVSSVEQLYNALYRPDLVREKLAGDPNGKVKAAAAQLDLDKVMASGMAPKVTITSPASGSSSATDEVAVEASISDQGGGIGKVEWRVNGVTLGLESRGLDRIEEVHTIKRTLALEPGDNRIEVLAYNAKGLIASEPAQITVKWDGAKTATPPRLYVLAVGVNDYYDSRLHLAYAVPDATSLAEAFQKAGTGLYASVEVKTVLDKEVTVANLDKVFTELSTKVQPRDVFVFFLAGHGKTENGRYYFLPRDFRYEDESSIQKAGMGQDKFQAWFAEIAARKSLLLYDTCESGSLTGATRGSDIDERLGALNRMARATGRTFLTATTDDAPALEGYHGHGVFTYALLDALDHADVNHDGLIEISELADYVDQKVPDYSYEAFKLRQIPQRSIVGNNFAVTNKAEVLAETAVDAADIPKKPTHVVVAPTDVKNDASDSAVTVTHLAPGTQVRLMETANGWVLIARDGQKLGYVQVSAIAGLQ
jgi:WD40 repeat protein